MALITVEAAAKELGISKRMMYELAAPHGPIPCCRIGRAVRFDPSDIENYTKSCRSTPTRPPVAGVSRLTVSSPDGESGLRSYFRKAGHVLKPKNSTKKKRADSTPLKLVVKPIGQQ